MKMGDRLKGVPRILPKTNYLLWRKSHLVGKTVPKCAFNKWTIGVFLYAPEISKSGQP
jgi:hypothetical protein